MAQRRATKEYEALEVRSTRERDLARERDRQRAAEAAERRERLEQQQVQYDAQQSHTSFHRIDDSKLPNQDKSSGSSSLLWTIAIGLAGVGALALWFFSKSE